MRRVLVVVTVGYLCMGCDEIFGSHDKRLKALEARVDDLQQKVAPAGAGDAGRPEVGRYQVVNPTPAYRRDTILLDTATGHTWITCTIQDNDGKPIPGTESNGWCEMSQAIGRGER